MTISIANKKITIIELEKYASNYESEDYSIILHGSFYRGSKRVDAGELLFLYKKYGKRTYKYLDGCGLLVVIDHKKECVICFTDYFNSNNFLFYKKTKSEIIISTSIFNLIGKTYSFNKNAVKKFLEQGYVEGKITTINGIKKMMPFHYLFIDYSLNVVLQKKCFYHFKNTFVSKETYNATIKNCVSECSQMDKFHKGCSCTLSAGYAQTICYSGLEIQLLAILTLSL